jgi:hypothetical protein
VLFFLGAGFLMLEGIISVLDVLSFEVPTPEVGVSLELLLQDADYERADVH